MSTVVLIANQGGDAVANHQSGRPVMPGHGIVMPTDVTPVARRGQLMVDVGDYWFKPSARRLRAGRYRLVVRSYGVTGHDVMVERMPIKLSGPGQPVDEAAPYGVDGLQPGTRMSSSMVLGPGRWEVFCSVAGHYMSGQHFELDVYGHMPRGMHERMHGMGGEGAGGGMGSGSGSMHGDGMM